MQNENQPTAISRQVLIAVGTTASTAQYALARSGYPKIGLAVGAIGATVAGAIDGSYAGPYGALIGGLTGLAWFFVTQVPYRIQYALDRFGYPKIGLAVGAIGAGAAGAIDGSFAGPYGALIGGLTGFACFHFTQAILNNKNIC